MSAPARLVPDASMAVKWFVRERFSDEALQLREMFAGRMAAPDLLLHECANVGWLNVRKGRMSFEMVRAMMASLPEMVSLAPPDAQLGWRAVSIAKELDHPAYDCFYLAFAEREGLVVATDDRRLLGAAKGGRWGDFVISLPDAAREWTK